MSKIHTSHSGIQSCIRRAKEVVYWPRMASDFECFVSNCQTCQTFSQLQQKEPMISTPIPQLPWQYVATDLFELKGQTYIVTVDYYSDFFELDHIYTKDSSEVIKRMKMHFARHGIPERLTSDNGAPFNSSKFAVFAQRYGFENITSSPHYPQSNGKAESAVKSAKRCLQKALHGNQDPYLALLELRNIPSEMVHSSPAQRLFGRRTRTQVPMSKSMLKPSTVSVQSGLERRKKKQEAYYNRGARELADLKPGQMIRFRPPGSKLWITATVDRQVDVRSYSIRTEDGSKFRRNRRQLRSVSVQKLMVKQDGPPKPTTQDMRPTRKRQKPTEAQNQEGIKPYYEQPMSPFIPSSHLDKKSVTSEQTPNKQMIGEKHIVVENEAVSPSRPSARVQTRGGRVVKRPTYLKDYV